MENQLEWMKDKTCKKCGNKCLGEFWFGKRCSLCFFKEFNKIKK